MLKKLKNNQGFTIIEVMIVLAIAALIILIVLLAVPALQRSSRNTTIKNDASTVASAISNYETNNNGVSPSYVQSENQTTPNGKVDVGSSSTDANMIIVKVQGSTLVWPELASKVTTAPTAVSSSGTATSSLIGPGQVTAWQGHTCAAAVSARATSVWYVTETGSGNQIQCIDT